MKVAKIRRRSAKNTSKSKLIYVCGRYWSKIESKIPPLKFYYSILSSGFFCYSSF